MKKTVCIILTLSLMLTVFFCMPVFADTYPTVYNAVSASSNNNNVYCEMKVVQLKGPTDPYQEVIPQATQQDVVINHANILVQLKLTNYNDYPCTVRNLAPRFVYSNSTADVYRRITDIQNYTDEMYLSITNASSYLDVLPSVYFSDGSLINVPPHRSITAIATMQVIIEMPVSQSVDPINFTTASIQSIQFYNGGIIAERTSNYPIGSNDEIISDLEAILDALNSSSSSSVSTDSGTLANQSDSVHQQEATYYAQNSAAIQATGLSNYQFDSTTVSGLQGVRGDFVDVWNSLGGWNSVYIFSLTLGLALTILRHSPSAISSAIKRKRYNNNE